METNIRGLITITNMSSELFNDALYFKELSEETGNILLKRRYQRSSLISFCASAESFMNQIIREQLNTKKNMNGQKLNCKEEELLNYIENAESTIPRGYSSVKRKLYNFLPNTITGKHINWDKNKTDAFEKYIELSKYRNSVVHYSHAKEKDIEKEKMESILITAPNIIQLLFEEYNNMNPSLKVPDFYKERKSKL